MIPRSRGGQHAWENCVASCTICNHRKADRLLEELGWTLAVPPVVPRGAHWRLVGAHITTATPSGPLICVSPLPR